MALLLAQTKIVDIKKMPHNIIVKRAVHLVISVGKKLGILGLLIRNLTLDALVCTLLA